LRGVPSEAEGDAAIPTIPSLRGCPPLADDAAISTGGGGSGNKVQIASLACGGFAMTGKCCVAMTEKGPVIISRGASRSAPKVIL